MILLVLRLGKGVELGFGGKSSVEDWCFRMNYQVCLVSCQRELSVQQLRGHRGMRFFGI